MPSKNLIFPRGSGVPLEPDIKKLEQAFGVPQEGVQIMWEKMEAVLGLSRKTPRFQSVYAAWKRRLLRDHNVVMIAVGNNQGVKVLIPDERIVYSVVLSEQGGKKLRKAILIADLTDPKRLTSPELVKSQLSITRLRTVNIEIYRHVQPKQLPDAKEALGLN